MSHYFKKWANPLKMLQHSIKCIYMKQQVNLLQNIPLITSAAASCNSVTNVIPLPCNSVTSVLIGKNKKPLKLMFRAFSS